MRNTAYHQQAQYITQQVLNVVQSNRDQIFQEVKATEDNILRALQLNSFSELNKHTNVPAPSKPEPAANVSTTDPIQVKMLEILQKIDKKLDGTTANKKQFPISICCEL